MGENGYATPRPHIRALPSLVLSTIALVLIGGEAQGASTLPSVCDPKAPAHGNVPDTPWAFAYSSWADPFASNAAEYHYRFVNQANNNIPVRWPDGGVIRGNTMPNEPVEATQTDALPAALRPSSIAVGPEGSGSHSYTKPNCFAADMTTRTSPSYANAVGSVLVFNIKGRIAGIREPVMVSIDLRVRSEVFREGDRYHVITSARNRLDSPLRLRSSQWVTLEASAVAPTILDQAVVSQVPTIRPRDFVVTDAKENELLSLRVLVWGIAR